jgi:hypothetical protein
MDNEYCVACLATGSLQDITTGRCSRFPQRPRVRSRLDALLPPDDPELEPWTLDWAAEEEAWTDEPWPEEEAWQDESDLEVWPPDEPWQPHWNALERQPVHFELAWFDCHFRRMVETGTLDCAGYYQDNDQLFNMLTDFVPFEDWLDLHVWASPDPQELDRDQLDRDQLDRDQLDRDRYDATRGGVLVYDRDACEADMLEHRIEALDEGARLQDLCFDAARARLQQLNEEDMLGLYVRHLPPDVDAETLIGRVPDRVWTFSIHRRPRSQT